MVSIEFCIDGSGKPRNVQLGEVREVLNEKGSLVWLNMSRSADTLKKVGEIFGFHGLAIEDAVDEHERPKAVVYPDYVFILFYGLTSSDDRIEPYPISMFVGKNYVVTVTDHPEVNLQEVSTRWHQFNESIKDRSPGTLAYTLLDALVDAYFVIMDKLGDRIETLETGLVEQTLHQPQREIHDMRMELLALRRVIGPEREAINTLLRRDVPVFDDSISTYMADVYDHVLRVLDWIDTYRDTLSNLSDLQISVASHKLNQTMRTMTAWSIIFMATTLVAGIYGMNFHRMPELSWYYGYPASLLLMLCLGGGIFFYFRQRDWL